MNIIGLIRIIVVPGLLAVFWFSSLPAGAQEDNEVFAARFLADRNPLMRLGRDQSFDRITRLGGATVFEYFNPPGFVILDEIDPSVLGYSLENLFYDGQNIPDLALMFLSGLEADGSLKAGMNLSTGGYDEAVGPLLLTHWGQGRFFNYYCPRDPQGPNGRVYPGCVAVAMAQIIRYYGRFNSFNLTHTHKAGPYGSQTAQLGGYNWRLMETDPVAVNRDISDLLYDLSVLLHTTYGNTGSSANSHRALEAFHELGYHDAILFRKRDFAPEAWTGLFYASLADESSPVLVTGGGHAFVCDGFDKEGYFHFNLGGTGYADGYYPLSIVLNYTISEAFINLSPVNHLMPPCNLRVSGQGERPVAVWSAPAGNEQVSYKIYIDENQWDETTDTIYPAGFLSPGIHTIHISSLSPAGESRWIGPATVYIKGSRLTFRENEVHRAIFKALGYPYGDTKDAQINEGDLYRISSLEIGDPGDGAVELALCTGLHKLVIRGTTGDTLTLDFLENLQHLKVLELHHINMSNPEKVRKLPQLSELRMTESPAGNLDFLNSLPNLMKFDYSGSPVSDPLIFGNLPYLDELILKDAGIRNAGFIAEIPCLQQIDLSFNSVESLEGIDFPRYLAKLIIPGNRLTGCTFLSDIENLVVADLSYNRIGTASFLSGLKHLETINLSNNLIDRFVLSTDLVKLVSMNLSENRLTGTGRLFFYTPALKSLDLSHNLILDLGENSCQSLERVDLSHNRLITTGWAALYPLLNELDLHANHISDLSGLTAGDWFRQLKTLKIQENPVSKESFDQYLPLLSSSISSFSGPDSHEPLSPCFPLPGNGSRITEFPVELKWQAEDQGRDVVYDLFCLERDSLIPIFTGLKHKWAVLDTPPDGTFKWVVASRLTDSVYYSGAYTFLTTEPLPLPFFEGFESFPIGGELSRLCPYWQVENDGFEGSDACLISSGEAYTGNQSLEIPGTARAGICLDHLDTPVLSVRFFTQIPEGNAGSFRLANINGMSIRVELNPAGEGCVFLNELPVSTFRYEHNLWVMFRAEVMARHNRVFMWVDDKLLINQAWNFPKGKVVAGSLEFGPDFVRDEGRPCSYRFFLDDLSVAVTETSGSESFSQPEGAPEVFPNPFFETINLRLPDSGQWVVTLSDATGRRLNYSLIVAAPGAVLPIRPGSLPSGMYVMQVRREYRNRVTGPPVKNSMNSGWTFRLIRSQSGY